MFAVRNSYFSIHCLTLILQDQQNIFDHRNVNMKLTPAFVMSKWSDKHGYQRFHYLQLLSSGALDQKHPPKITIADKTLHVEMKMRPAMLDPEVVFNSKDLCKDDTVVFADRKPYHDENSPVFQGYRHAVNQMAGGRDFVPVQFSVPLPHDDIILTPESISGHESINYLTRNPATNTFEKKKALILMLEVKNTGKTGKASKLSERSRMDESWEE